MKSEIAHKIKHRENPNDEFYTPIELAEKLVKLVPITKNDIICDNALGKGVFLEAFKKTDAAIKQGYSLENNFFKQTKKQSWFITNPPYSKIDEWLEHSCKYATKGFAYLFGFHNLTPRRIELCENYGFVITKIHLCKVFEWFGISAFIVWEKKAFQQKIKLTYDRIVWR